MNREKISSGLLNPRSKLAVFIAACLSAFSGLTHPQEFVLLALCVGITLLCQKWKRAFYTGLIFTVMFFCDLFLTPRLSGKLLRLASSDYINCKSVESAVNSRVYGIFVTVWISCKTV